MRSVARYAFVAVAALVCTASAVSAQSTSRIKKDPNQIVSEEIRSTSATNAFELVQSLRPRWLRISGRQTTRTQATGTINPMGGSGVAQVMDEPEIIVYMNNTRFGTVESLRDLSVGSLSSLEFVTPAKATMRWGAGHMHGAIVVRTTADLAP